MRQRKADDPRDRAHHQHVKDRLLHPDDAPLSGTSHRWREAHEATRPSPSTSAIFRGRRAKAIGAPADAPAPAITSFVLHSH
jgi:hypothetical protein